ncbi:MAG: ornithine cyclodeaminase family protein [Sphingomonadales bacterium]|jgi:ornithine cyclodeaminase/alanine dehydrogenase-like protein (mu-crystallin family)|nr:ornithine cyclodeaminase family protein [Sphingomonadales bacterium]
MTPAPFLSLNAERTADALAFPSLIPALRDAFASGASVPLRHHHAIPQPDGTIATLLLMPAWQDGGFLGVKIVSVFPGNAARNVPALHSTFLLSDGTTGAPLGLLDGNEITSRRTAGVAALAASFLSRPDASTLLIVGAGRVGRLLAPAFREVRPIQQVNIFARLPEKAEALVSQLREEGFAAHVVSHLENAVRSADIISCATLATEPLIRGEWLKPGAHLDLIGAFTPAMREADDVCLKRGRLFIDTPAALHEAGDLTQPLADGVIDETDVCATLGDLCAGRLKGRWSNDQITIFKSVGTALADIAAGALAYRTATVPSPASAE